MLDRSDLQNEVKIKVLLLGDGAVGKTSLAVRYTHEKFSSSYKPSLGVDFMLKRVEVNGQRVKIMVFDTAGQEFISSLRKRYYSGAHGVIVVFDVTRERVRQIEAKALRKLRHPTRSRKLRNFSEMINY